MLVVGLNKNDSSNMWLIHVIWTSIVVKTTGWGGDDDTAASVTPSNSHMLTSLKLQEEKHKTGMESSIRYFLLWLVIWMDVLFENVYYNSHNMNFEHHH